MFPRSSIHSATPFSVSASQPCFDCTSAACRRNSACNASASSRRSAYSCRCFCNRFMSGVALDDAIEADDDMLPMAIGMTSCERVRRCNSQ